MSGICGSFSDLPRIDAREVVDRMLRAMDHTVGGRRQQHHEPAKSIAMGRMAPEYARTSAEPFVLPDQEMIAVMDGELYAADQLRRDLEEKGCRFTGDSDTELVVRGYLAEGTPFFCKLTGKFSAAIYDGAQNRLLLVNDKFGMRPLYYSQVGERFLFASEIKSLLVDDEVSRKPSERGIAQFFAFGQLWGEDTMYASIRAMPAAGFLVSS